MSGRQVPAASRYRGLRLTVTQAPGDDRVWVTLAAKSWTGKWDEWRLLAPAARSDIGTSLEVDIEHLLRTAITVALDRLEE